MLLGPYLTEVMQQLLDRFPGHLGNPFRRFIRSISPKLWWPSGQNTTSIKRNKCGNRFTAKLVRQSGLFHGHSVFDAVISLWLHSYEMTKCHAVSIIAILYKTTKGIFWHRLLLWVVMKVVWMEYMSFLLRSQSHSHIITHDSMWSAWCDTLCLSVWWGKRAGSTAVGLPTGVCTVVKPWGRRGRTFQCCHCARCRGDKGWIRGGIFNIFWEWG